MPSNDPKPLSSRDHLEDLIEPVLPEDQEEDEVEHFRFTPTKNITRRIDQYLVDRLPYLSRAAVQRIIEDGLVKVNGKPCKASYKPKDGDVVDMIAPPKPVSELVPEPIPLDVVYEDEHFMAINKQAGLMVHPARGKWTGTLVNGLVYYGQKWSSINGNWRPGILHRLDKNTTGIMLVAKSDEAHWRLARQFENRTIQKTYVCIAHGVPQLLADVVNLPIGKDRYVRERQAIRKEENGGKPAVTKYEVLEMLDQKREASSQKPEAKDEGGRQKDEKNESALQPSSVIPHPPPTPHPSYTLHPSSFPKDKALPAPPQRFCFIKMYPKTGRTHQLRVHLMAIGHPMVGDTMYGGRVFESGDFRFERQALHAAEITFTHPATLEQMTLAAPLPPDMTRLLGILRGTAH